MSYLRYLRVDSIKKLLSKKITTNVSESFFFAKSFVNFLTFAQTLKFPTFRCLLFHLNSCHGQNINCIL